MARTRDEISALVVLNTARPDKTTLIESLCDTALKLAMTKHNFSDAMKICDDVTITEDATEVDISGLLQATVSIGTLLDIVTARIVQADGTQNKILSIKNRQWWDREVVNPEDNQKGWPDYGLKFGTNMLLSRPAESNLELRLRVATVPTFAAGSTECPIEVLDIFVEQYVTAMVFLSISMQEKYVSWYIMALGRRFDVGETGGTLLAAIERDKRESAEDKLVRRPGSIKNAGGLSITNKTSGMDTTDETHTWY